ncbi:MobF family relaxase [Streptomyces sp. WAC05858]|uniref:MobF family relaxase n=1 Tax=Streptomyces TaxID=1883 RepID=UPI0021B08209|nr:MobF family relaxase [Streptomyces sp. WAC05858]
MLSKGEVRPGGWPYYFRSVMVGDGQRVAGTRLRAAQDEAGVPPGVWKGRGLAAVGLAAGDVVTERQAELLLGEGRHPDADRIERERLEAGDDPAKARRATVLGRPIEHNQSPETDKAKERTPWLAIDLTFRAPSTAQIAWALGDEETRLALELCQDIARDKTLAWLEESVAEIRWGSDGKHRARVKDGLIVAVFRHYESRAGKPLLHDHAVVSIRARRPDDKGTWGNLSTDSMLEHIVAAGTLYTLHFMEEVSARLGWAWEPREVTPGKRQVMEIAGIDQRLIGWQSTRRQQIADALPLLLADYEEAQGHPPGERAAYALDCQAADQTRPPKRKVARSLSELRERWRKSAIGKVGACVVYRLIERARAAAAAVWARVRPVVDVVLAAVDITAVVYVMRGAFRHQHLLAEARRHLTHTLRGRPHEPGLDEQIVQAAIDGYTRPIGSMMTADLRALYPHDIENQAVVRPLTRARAKSPYERARLAAGALTARVHAARRSRRLNSRSLPHTAAPVGLPPRSRLDRSEARASRAAKKAGPALDTDVATVGETQRVIQTVAAKIQDGIRERAAARDPGAQPAPATPPQPYRTQQPGAQPAPGRSTPTKGGAA